MISTTCDFVNYFELLRIVQNIEKNSFNEAGGKAMRFDYRKKEVSPGQSLYGIKHLQNRSKRSKVEIVLSKKN